MCGSAPRAAKAARRAADRLVETVAEPRPEAARERGARQRIEIADPAQAEPVELGHRRAVEPQCRDRERCEAPCADHRAAKSPATGTATNRAAAQAAPGVSASPACTSNPKRPMRREILQQRVLAAGEMRAAGDVEPDALAARRIVCPVTVYSLDRTVDRGPGRIAAAPVGQPRQRRRIARRIGRSHDELRQQRARIGNRHAGQDAGGTGIRIGHRDERAAASVLAVTSGVASGGLSAAPTAAAKIAGDARSQSAAARARRPVDGSCGTSTFHNRGRPSRLRSSASRQRARSKPSGKPSASTPPGNAETCQRVVAAMIGMLAPPPPGACSSNPNVPAVSAASCSRRPSVRRDRSRRPRPQDRACATLPRRPRADRPARRLGQDQPAGSSPSRARPGP